MKLRYYVINFAAIVVFSAITLFPLNLTDGNMILAYENTNESNTTITIENGKEKKSRLIYNPYEREYREHSVTMLEDSAYKESTTGRRTIIQHLPIPDANAEIYISPLCSEKFN